MTDIAAFHVATIRQGEFDRHANNDALSSISHDQKTSYYDLTGMGVTKAEFESFAATAWDRDPDEEINAMEWPSGVYRVSLD